MAQEKLANEKYAPEVRELVINNLQKTYPLLTDRSLIQQVLMNEKWDLNKSQIILKKLHYEFYKKQKKTTEGESLLVETLPNKKKSLSEILKECEESKKNKLITKSKNPNSLSEEKIHLPEQMYEIVENQNDRINQNKIKLSTLKKNCLLIEQLNDPFDRIVAYLKFGVRVMVFMRGCPGSGKSTYARELLSSVGVSNSYWHILSADDFFVDDTSGKYAFNPDLIGKAHEWNNRLVTQAVIEGRSPVVVDNTHTRLWEMKDNATTGVDHGYIIETLEPKTSWFLNDEELKKRTIHKVTIANIRRMTSRYERNISGNDLIHLLRLTYNRQPPMRQSCDTRTPPSKKTIKLYQSKVEIKTKHELAEQMKDLLLQADKEHQPVDSTVPNKDLPVVDVNNGTKIKQSNFQEFNKPSSSCISSNVNIDQKDCTYESNVKSMSWRNERFNSVELTSKLLSNEQKIRAQPSPKTSFSDSHMGEINLIQLNSTKDEVITSSSDDENNYSDDNIADEDESDDEKSITGPSSSSSSSTIMRDILQRNKCKEYVMITSDEKLLYQKHHENAPSVLKDLQSAIDENDKKQNLSFDKFLENYLKQKGFSGDKHKIGVKHDKTNAMMDFKDESDSNDGIINNNKLLLEASSNTNYRDFEMLKEVNRQSDIGKNQSGILIGRPTFKSVPFNKHGGSERKVPTLLMLDKSIMTNDINPNCNLDVVYGVDSLALMFPTLKRESLEEFLNNDCNNDLDYAVNLLLDSGTEMSSTCILPDINKYCKNMNEKKTESTASSSIEMNSSNAVVTPGKRKKKTIDSLTGNSLDLIQNFQDKFKLSDDCYSETINKIRKRRTGEELLCKSTSEDTIGKETTAVVDEDEEEATATEEETEEDVELVMEKHVVLDLQRQFGGLLSANLIGDQIKIHIPKSLARQLYSYAFDAINEDLEKKQAIIDMLINDSLDNEGVDKTPKSHPSFQEIMDHELALHLSQPKDTSRSQSIASILSRKLLTERFPNIDSSTLTSILEDTNHSLYEATNLLKLAGHNEMQEASQDTAKEDQEPLSRREAIMQANAYSDVAGKLYDMREDSLKKAELAISQGNKTVALYYSEMAKWYSERIEQSNSLAASAMLTGHESATTLDLHFLPVKQAVKVLDLFLDEKIRTIPRDKNQAYVYVITGRGKHSPKGICKMKMVVQALLKKRNIKFRDENPGMLRAAVTKNTLISYKQNDK